MAKFFGAIGFVSQTETSPGSGIWKDSYTTKNYYGDVQKNTRKWEASDKVNDNLNVNNIISIVADAYASQNFHAMRYIEWMGSKWEITNVEVARPRLILTIGGVFNP